MKHFQLQTLFNLRERARKKAEDDFLFAQQDANRQAKHLNDLQEDLTQKIHARAARRQQYANNNGASLSIHHLRIQESHVHALKNKEEAARLSVEEQKEVLEKSKGIVQTKQTHMLVATREFKSIEKLKEQWKFQQKKESERREEIALDEISQSKHVLSRAKT